MTEPTTEAGRRLLMHRAHQHGIDLMDERAMAVAAADILAIEAEARAPLREALRDAFREAEARTPAEPEGLDVERLAWALHRVPDRHGATLNEYATAIARAYAALPEDYCKHGVLGGCGHE